MVNVVPPVCNRYKLAGGIGIGRERSPAFSDLSCRIVFSLCISGEFITCSIRLLICFIPSSSTTFCILWKIMRGVTGSHIKLVSGAVAGA